ncbi:hypothetical protein [uncultured Bartonella sp.]|nr:hypothetical protein [uncultured Bartonella sp.]
MDGLFSGKPDRGEIEKLVLLFLVRSRFPAPISRSLARGSRKLPDSEMAG